MPSSSLQVWSYWGSHLRAFVDDDMVWLLSRGLFPVAAALSVFGKMRKGGFAEVIRWGSFISCCVVAHYPYCVAQYSNTSSQLNLKSVVHPRIWGRGKIFDLALKSMLLGFDVFGLDLWQAALLCA